jgi:MarR family transcriptional regulator, temperature-dependent positive regulator of motility
MSKTQQAKAVDIDGISLFDLNLSLVHLLHRAGQVAGDSHFAAFGKDGLTPRQIALLLTLANQEDISQTQLVSATGIDRSTLAEMIARMTAKGLIGRAISPSDKRVKRVALASAGQAALGEAIPKLALIEANMLARFSAKKRTTLLSLLSELVVSNPAQDAKPSAKAKKKDKKKKEKRKRKSDPTKAAVDHDDSQ